MVKYLFSIVFFVACNHLFQSGKLLFLYFSKISKVIQIQYFYANSSDTVIGERREDTSTEISSSSSNQSLNECSACKLDKFKFSWEDETDAANVENNIKQSCRKDKELVCSKVNFLTQQPQIQLGLLIGDDVDRSKSSDETMNEMQKRNDKIICLVDQFYNNQAIVKALCKESDTESTAL